MKYDDRGSDLSAIFHTPLCLGSSGMATTAATTAAALAPGIDNDEHHHNEESSKRTLLLNRKKEIQTRLKDLDSSRLLRPGGVADVVAPEAGVTGDGGIAGILSMEDTSNNARTAATMLASLPDVTRPRLASTVIMTTTSTSSSIPLSTATTAASSSSSYDVTPRTDVHWDYALKEMAWLSADFKSERKRQTSSAKKLSNAILQYFATLSIKKTRERAQNEARVRRLASKLARNVRNEYWQKMERVVEYKQRVVSEQGRRTEMDKRLIFLVKQTERYGECLLTTTTASTTTPNDGDNGDNDGVVMRKSITIEEALSNAANDSLGHRRRTQSYKSIDYTRMNKDVTYNETTFYGESIATSHHSSSKRSIRPVHSSPLSSTATIEKGDNIEQIINDDDDDDNFTLIDNEDEIVHELHTEEEEYTLLVRSFKEEYTRMEVDDEVRLLLQERNMDIEDLLLQLIEEGTPGSPSTNDDDDNDDVGDGEGVLEDGAHVSQRPMIEVIDETIDTSGDDNETDEIEIRVHVPAMYYDDDDDDDEGKTSGAIKKINDELHVNKDNFDVDDCDEDNEDNEVETPNVSKSPFALLNEDDHEEKDEFHVDGDEMDDETTIEVEERLGRDMSYQDEIDLLKRENEMSIDDLRALYASMEEGGEYDKSDASSEGDDLSIDVDGRSENGVTLALLHDDDHEEKDEFHVDGDEMDDETTIEVEERLGRDMSYQDEIDLLKRENAMSIDELRALYTELEEAEDDENDASSKGDDASSTNMDKTSDEGGTLALLNEDDHEEKDEFHLENEEIDDETTIEVEERLGRDMSYQNEIDLLKRENEMSIDDLRALYANIEDQTNEGEESEVEYDENHELTTDSMDTFQDKCSKQKHLLVDESNVINGKTSKKAKLEEKDDEGITALASLAASETKVRETMLTRPFLLASWVKLRAYQHVGLNWLVSIQTRRLNGILADEMGLGKTLQTISMLAYLASYKGIWGPHLIIVPTSCLVNWEVEFKRFCPGLKVMCYYGDAKKRKELRTGWTKPNVFHVVITSYQLAVKDSFAFKRKKWYYLLLDEAHNIKNFESQRWQTLISFNTQRRLLLTGTPLQNNLMELWSLLHFLMPHVFTDRKQFSYWFSNPMDSIIEGNTKRNDDLINRLHGIIRPFVLRRLKKDVEKQLPGKFEHIIKCQLSRRQMFLYEEFMARSSTRKAVSGGNFMGMMNVLMQLRKVCNHPDLFEPRSVTTPFVMEPLSMSTASCVINAVEPTSALEQLSPYVRLSLWAMGRGTPSFEDATFVDSIFAGQLAEHMTQESVIIDDVTDEDLVEPMPPPGIDDGLVSFLIDIRDTEKHDRVSRAKFVGGINKHRCQTEVFPYSDRMRRAVFVDLGFCNLPGTDDLTVNEIAATPLELLAMRKSQEDRAQDLDEIADKFIFCVPKAGALKPVLFSHKPNATTLLADKSQEMRASASLQNYFTPFKKAISRLTMCFPDKKLVQFDAGKLQTLATLLRELKQGGHRVLIFTQMSKMLDVLEAFLNLNGHTYLRLDGATDVDRRQRLMDRFNNDPKVFCFILSTRSGGLGINLTGADTVVFYDSDWNPAMDAQAQDRAHRIGQTREVHIYRMITEHSIEENILTKAKQKRNLDFLVMDEGNFNANIPELLTVDDEQTEGDTFTKDKLQNILGIHADDEELPTSDMEVEMSKDQVESAMAALEDEDDVKAMHNTMKEAAEELQEFDEAILDKQEEQALDGTKKVEELNDGTKSKIKRSPSTDSTESDNPKAASDNEAEMEKEFAQWQRRVGMDANTIYESLNPLERYGLHIKEQINPYYSKYFWAEQQRLFQTISTNNEWNIEEIEQRKVQEELKAFEDGDLLATFPEPESLPRQRQLYIREKARLRSDIMRRKLTGKNWIAKVNEHSGNTFWYNNDTGEASIEQPQVLKMLEAEKVARSEGWSALPYKPLFNVMDFLIPYPERQVCAMTCSKWRSAANDPAFVLHVWPVELGALVMDVNKLGKNHFKTINDANNAALPGDSIELGDGHYFINDSGLVIDKPLKIVGDENDPAHVVLEMSGEIVWKSCGGWMEGITIRRPRISTGVSLNSEILRLEGRLDMFHCVFDNRGSSGNCVSVRSGGVGRWERAIINGASRDKHGLLIEKDAKLDLLDCCIADNDGVGTSRDRESAVTMRRCTVVRNGLAPVKKEDEAVVPQLIMIDSSETHV